MHSFYKYVILLSVVISSCKTSRIQGNDDGKLEVIFIQVNDVYEIAPLDNGKQGGMARVATLEKQYLQQNSNTFLLMAGDFVSPSVYNSLQYQGKRIRGKQMIEVMNAAGMDLVIFGNHEFDINENELQERINESDFQWVSSNTFHKKDNNIVPFAKVRSNSAFPKTYFLSLTDADGTTARIGFIGITLPFNKADYVSYSDPLSTARNLYNQIKDSCDAVIAITHQFMQDDILLAKEVPGLAMIIGGHEHDMRFEKVGNVYITKAHANAKSAYVLKLLLNKRKNKIRVTPELKYLNESVALDSVANIAVQKWLDIADQNFSSLGFNARDVVLATGAPLDGRETEVRGRSTNLTTLIVDAIAHACPEAEVVIMNSGSIRVDDILNPPITQYDIIRTLPYGGAIYEVKMKGNLLVKTLEAGRKNVGLGGYLQYKPVVFDQSTNTWLLNNKPIEADSLYRVALTDFLLSGKEVNLDFLNKDNPGINVYQLEKAGLKSDIRLAVIDFLKKKPTK